MHLEITLGNSLVGVFQFRPPRAESFLARFMMYCVQFFEFATYLVGIRVVLETFVCISRVTSYLKRISSGHRS